MLSIAVVTPAGSRPRIEPSGLSPMTEMPAKAPASEITPSSLTKRVPVATVDLENVREMACA